MSEGSHQNDGVKVFVYGVASSCPKSIIEDEFARIGKVNHVYITGKGYAFVTFENLDDANEACKELNGATVDGQEIKVELAKPKREGERRYDNNRGYNSRGYNR